MTADGLRRQEIFAGIDAELMKAKETGMNNRTDLVEQLWRPSAEERRQTLMPFFWKTLARGGVVLGNLTRGSSVKVTNAYRVSYPGYAEILTGQAQDQTIRGNDKIQNPSTTILEFARAKLGLTRSQVALFASWDTFRWIGESRPGSIVINAGFQQFSDPPSTRIGDLSRMQFDLLTPWDGARHDYITFEMAIDYLRTEKPRLMYVAFDETDDWAHSKRYDRVLESIQYFDRCLERLWSTLQSMPEYRGKTSIVITSDHGRGSTIGDWDRHGAKVEGAEFIWVAIAGPDTPVNGELSKTETVHQRDVGPTVLKLLGIDPNELKTPGQPIAAGFRR
jgi:hypothetical protein